MLTILAIPFAKSSTSSKGHILGEERFDMTTGKWYRFIDLDTDLTGNELVLGEVVLAMATANRGTTKKANSLDTTNVVVLGVGAGATGDVAESASSSARNYCWIQLSGRCSTVKKKAAGGSDTIAVGDVVIADAATDSKCIALGDSTAVTGIYLKAAFGYCLVAAIDADTTVDCYLRWLR